MHRRVSSPIKASSHALLDGLFFSSLGSVLPTAMILKWAHS